MTETLRPGSTVALRGRVGTITRLDTRPKKPGVWWRLRMLNGTHETHEQSELEFIYQERNGR